MVSHIARPVRPGDNAGILIRPGDDGPACNGQTMREFKAITDVQGPDQIPDPEMEQDHAMSTVYLKVSRNSA